MSLWFIALLSLLLSVRGQTAVPQVVIANELTTVVIYPLVTPIIGDVVGFFVDPLCSKNVSSVDQQIVGQQATLSNLSVSVAVTFPQAMLTYVCMKQGVTAPASPELLLHPATAIPFVLVAPLTVLVSGHAFLPGNTTSNSSNVFPQLPATGQQTTFLIRNLPASFANATMSVLLGTTQDCGDEVGLGANLTVTSPRSLSFSFTVRTAMAAIVCVRAVRDSPSLNSTLLIGPIIALDEVFSVLLPSVILANTPTVIIATSDSIPFVAGSMTVKVWSTSTCDEGAAAGTVQDVYELGLSMRFVLTLTQPSAYVCVFNGAENSLIGPIVTAPAGGQSTDGEAPGKIGRIAITPGTAQPGIPVTIRVIPGFTSANSSIRIQSIGTASDTNCSSYLSSNSTSQFTITANQSQIGYVCVVYTASTAVRALGTPLLAGPFQVLGISASPPLDDRDGLSPSAIVALIVAPSVILLVTFVALLLLLLLCRPKPSMQLLNGPPCHFVRGGGEFVDSEPPPFRPPRTVVRGPGSHGHSHGHGVVHHHPGPAIQDTHSATYLRLHGDDHPATRSRHGQPINANPSIYLSAGPFVARAPSHYGADHQMGVQVSHHPALSSALPGPLPMSNPPQFPLMPPPKVVPMPPPLSIHSNSGFASSSKSI